MGLGRAEVVVDELRESLARWFESNRRDLPWRVRPSPYSVWVSEIMLQQTRAQVVVDYFERWMAALPTLDALAEADEGLVLSLWQGLGYYSRARRLREGARFVREEYAGEIPRSVDALLRIPGVGRYTAGAIASQAFGERAPIVDGNVQRVLTRVFALRGLATKEPLVSRLWSLAELFVAEGEPSIVNQGLMELGALVCTPRRPSCPTCPWVASCRAFAGGEPESFPELPTRARATPVTLVVFLVVAGGCYLVERRPEGARWWAGLSTFPLLELGSATGGAVGGRLAECEMPEGPDRVDAVADDDVTRWVRALGTILDVSGAKDVRPLPAIAHQVTRYRLNLVPLSLRLPGRRPPRAPDGLEWVPRAELLARSWPGPLGRLARRLAED